jgi:putative transposase
MLAKISFFMVRKANHCAFDIHYHLVIVMKYRKKILIKQEYITRLCDIIKGIGERYEYEIEEIGSDGDHVHILLSAFPRDSPSRIMNTIKSITAKEMFKSFSEIKKQLWGGEFWSDGGFVGTIGQAAGLEHMRKYVKNQGKKDKNNSLKNYLN